MAWVEIGFRQLPPIPDRPHEMIQQIENAPHDADADRPLWEG
jgi:hypothetical protein